MMDRDPIQDQTFDEDRGGSSSLSGLVETFWRHKSPIFFGMTLGVLAAVLYYLQATPIYQADAQVLVVQKRPDRISSINTQGLAADDYVSTHLTLMKSPLIIESAIERHGLNSLRTLTDLSQRYRDKTPRELISERLWANRDRSGGINATNVVNLSFQSPYKEECPIILNAIVDTYEAFLDETFRNVSKETVKLIDEAQTVLEDDLAKLQSDYRKFRRSAPLLSFGGQDGFHLRTERLLSLDKRHALMLIRQAELQARIQAIDDALKKEHNPEKIQATIAEWLDDSGSGDINQRSTVSMQAQLLTLLQKQERLLETKGENHPEVVAVREQVEKTRAFLSNPLAPYEKEWKFDSKQNPVETVRSTREHFQEELGRLEFAKEVMTNLIEEERRQVQELATYEIDEEDYRTRIQQKREIVDTIVKRLNEIDLVKDVGGFQARTIAVPLEGKKVKPNGLVVFPLGGFFGVLFGCGLAFMAEVFDKSFRSLEDVRQRLKLPIVGQVPHLQDMKLEGKTAFHPHLVTVHRPRSVEAESYRGLRTSLFFSTLTTGRSLIQVTSSVEGEGKTTLASNLAVAIAQSNKRILLIDADLRRPRVNEVFGLSNDVGLASVIVGQVEIFDAMIKDVVPNLDVIPAGPIPPNPADLLTSPRFKEILTVVRDKYDFVIVDTPPVLIVSDPSIVAPNVDGLVLVLRLTRKARPIVVRAKEVLEALGVNILGVALNAVGKKDSFSAYYAQYGYGYVEGYHAKGEGEEENPEDEDSKKGGEHLTPDP